MRSWKTRILPGLLLIFSLTAAVFAQNSDAKAKVEEILKQARAAVGDEAKLKALQTLQFSGSTRRVFGEREITSEIEFEMMMPDKIKRTSVTAPFPGADFTSTEVINGSQVWYDSVSNMPPGIGGGAGGGCQHGQHGRVGTVRAGREQVNGRGHEQRERGQVDASPQPVG